MDVPFLIKNAVYFHLPKRNFDDLILLSFWKRRAMGLWISHG